MTLTLTKHIWNHERSLLAYHLLEAGYTLHECLEHCDGRLDCDTTERSSMAYRLHRGGACGSDTYWQKQMKSRGFETVVYSFEGHQIQNNSRLILKEDTLHLADVHLNRANETLKRYAPNSSNYVSHLLRRNVLIFLNAGAVFAVTNLRQNRAMGGTAWGVQLAIDLGKPVYVFDMGLNQWKEYRDGRFVPYPTPKLTNEFAGIGSRFLTQGGKDAINQVFEVTFGKQSEVVDES